MKAPVSVIILTFNEALNIQHALSSVCGWAEQVIVLDSLSTDDTVAQASTFDCRIHTARFENFSSQRNYALEKLPISQEWVFFLDADEWPTSALKSEIAALLASSPAEHGFYVNRRFYWMGKWIKRGYYPSWLLRLMRRRTARYDARVVNEHPIVDGPVAYLRNDLIHEDHRDVSHWIEKHNGYATMEAQELVRELAPTFPKPRLRDAIAKQELRKKWVKLHLWNRLPPLVRPYLYFFYRGFLRGGFLDGSRALSYHLLQALWYQMVIDLKFIEITRKRVESSARVPE